MDLVDVMREYQARDHHPLYPEAVAHPPKKKYLMAFTPRSGSTLLTHHLSRSLYLGHPGEYLNEGFIGHFEHLFPPPNLADFENFVLTNFTSPTGVFGLKTDWWRFCRAREIGYLTRLFSDVDLHIFLRRDDLIGQAVSLSISMQTNVWHDSNIRFSDPAEVYADLRYDDAQIAENLISLLEQEYQWRRYLDAAGGPLIELVYEDAVLDMENACRRIASALGLPFEIADIEAPPTMKPVPSGVNGAWKQRFIDEKPELAEAAMRQRGTVSPVGERWPRKLREGLALDGPRPAPRPRHLWQ